MAYQNIVDPSLPLKFFRLTQAGYNLGTLSYGALHVKTPESHEFNKQMMREGYNLVLMYHSQPFKECTSCIPTMFWDDVSSAGPSKNDQNSAKEFPGAMFVIQDYKGLLFYGSKMKKDWGMPIKIQNNENKVVAVGNFLRAFKILCQPDLNIEYDV